MWAADTEKINYRIRPENIRSYRQKLPSRGEMSSIPSTTVPLRFSVLFLYSGSASGWGSHGNRIPIRGLHAVSGIQKKNSPHWWPWQHTLWVHILPETLIGAPSVFTPSTLLPNPALLIGTYPPPTMLYLGAGVQLPACSWESSPAPRKLNYPLHCGMLLWSPHSWWRCLDWASTGDTWPTNKIILSHFTACCVITNTYMQSIES